MIKNAQNANIPLNKGISRTQAIAEEGELSTCVNLVPRGGELKPIAPPVETGIDLAGNKLLAVHNVGADKHYICYRPTSTPAPPRPLLEGALFWTDGDETWVDFSVADQAPKAVQTTGNILLVTWEDDSIQYFIWRDGEYQDLGAGLPDVKVQLALNGELQMGTYSSLLHMVNGPAAGGYNYQDPVTISGTTDHRDDHTRYVYITLQNPLLGGYSYKFTNLSAYETTVMFEYGFGTVKKVIKVNESAEVVIKQGPPNNNYSIDKIRLSAYKTGIHVTLSVRIEKGDYDQAGNYIPDETVENLDALKSVANSFINTAMQQDGQFVLPFFARVGLRLYDGSIVNLSPPILMLPNTGNAPAMIVLDSKIDGVSDRGVSAFGYQCDLMYKISSADLAALQSEGWADLITGLVFAISRPIYTYNEGYVFDGDKKNLPFSTTKYSYNSGVLEGLSPIRSVSGSNGAYGWKKLENDIGGLLNFGQSDDERMGLQVHLPSFTDAEVYKSYTEKGDFYVLDEIKIGDLTADLFTALDLTEKDLTAVASFEQVIDSESRNVVSGKLSFEYNSRLHIANTTETIWPGISPFMLQGYDDNWGTGTDISIRAVVRISKDAQEVYADTGWIDGKHPSEFLYWFCYPDSNAVSADIYLRRESLGVTGYKQAKIALRKHEFLNLAYWFESLKSMEFFVPEFSEGEPEFPTGTKLYYPNKLYVSDAANPFIFRSQSHVRVGSGEIRGMSTAVQALSQGQFGQFPLYVFCSDGIWALEVGSTGAYEAAKPVSRDVLTNPDSVTQLDNAVAFVTDKGLMCISGSKVELLSEKLDGLVSDDDFIEDTLQTFGTKISETVPFVSHTAQSSEFKTLVQNAKIVYDYAGSRLHVFTDGDILHYVYSLKTGEWASQILDSDYDLLSIVPGYPETLLQFEGKDQICAYKATPASDPIICYALTRSIPFGAPFTRKMLADLRLIGQRAGQDSLRRVAVYISDDEINWVKLTSLHRMSAKYFRFLVMGYLYEEQSLSGITAQIVEKYTDKMR